MLLSKRRFDWAFLVLILSGIAFFVRPVRSWIDQLLVRQIDPNMRVASVHLHLRDSVVEMEGFLWSKYHNKQAFGLRADRAWLAVEPEPLLDGKLVIPAGSMENVVLFFSDEGNSLEQPDDLWQTELAQNTRSVDWVALQEHFTSLLASGSVIKSVHEQIQEWSGRSQEIQREVQSIVNNELYADNPLRHEDELREKLGRIEALFVKHQKIIREFSNTSDEVHRRCDELSLALSQQSLASRKQSLKGMELEKRRLQIAKALLLQIAQQQWQDISDKVRVTQFMAKSLPNVSNENSGQTIKLVEDDGQFLKAENIRAEGIFAHGDARERFRMDMFAGFHEDAAFQMDSTWDYTFASPENWIAVHVDVARDRLHSNLELVVLSRELDQTSPSDHGPGKNRLPYAQDMLVRQDFATRVVIQEQPEDSLSGLMELRATRFGQQKLFSEVFDYALQKAGRQDFAYGVRLSGNWRTPVLTLEGEAPQWLAEAVQERINHKFSESNSVQDAKLREEFAGQIAKLREAVEIALNSGMQQIRRNDTELSSLSRGLRGRLEDITGESFMAAENGVNAPDVR